MTWTEALRKIAGRRKATSPITNAEASGLILFARELARHLANGWDWYGYATPALAWNKRGDRFDTSARNARATYPAAPHLFAALVDLAMRADAAGLPVKLYRDPQGSLSTLGELAREAWKFQAVAFPDDDFAARVTKARAKMQGVGDPTPDMSPVTMTDPNNVMWTMTRNPTDNSWTADTQPNALYHPIHLGPEATKPEVIARVEQFVRNMAQSDKYNRPGPSDASSATPPAEADDPSAAAAGKKKKPPPDEKTTGSGGWGAAILLALAIAALDK
jgi:hypothetical protein